MRILILGGGSFVGRAIVEASTSRGHDVTTLTRTTLPPGASSGYVEAMFGDRTQPGALDFAKDQQWDVVFDTWWHAPRVVQLSAQALRPHAAYYSYVSSCSVYSDDPIPYGLNENSKTADADPSSETTNYAADKRGGELAVLDAFGKEGSFLARPGIILGPNETPGRLPWWLNRISQGGEVLAPGPRDLPLQYIDARDLAEWMVASAEQKLTGVFNAISPRGHTTMSELLESCRRTSESTAELTWVTPEFLARQEIQPWTEMPIWVDPALYGMFNINTTLAADSGLTCRSVHETVEDTWKQMKSKLEIPTSRPGLGIEIEKEKAALAAWANQS